MWKYTDILGRVYTPFNGICRAKLSSFILLVVYYIRHAGDDDIQTQRTFSVILLLLLLLTFSRILYTGWFFFYLEPRYVTRKSMNDFRYVYIYVSDRFYTFILYFVMTLIYIYIFTTSNLLFVITISTIDFSTKTYDF